MAYKGVNSKNAHSSSSEITSEFFEVLFLIWWFNIYFWVTLICLKYGINKLASMCLHYRINRTFGLFSLNIIFIFFYFFIWNFQNHHMVFQSTYINRQTFWPIVHPNPISRCFCNIIFWANRRRKFENGFLTLLKGFFGPGVILLLQSKKKVKSLTKLQSMLS